MFSDKPRCQYKYNPLAEVICQLRFPEILSITANPPVDFQEVIRDVYPNFSSKVEAAAPKLKGQPGNFTLENQPSTVNYQFTSEDGFWRINLTNRFISLTCNKYTCWEDFAKMFDKPLVALIRAYKPAYFERVGLRYINFISKRALSLDDAAFADLIQPQYLGILADAEIDEQQTARTSVDAEFSIKGGCRAKLHAGPGMVKQNGIADNEVKFVFDQDIYLPGNVPVNYAAGALETLHSQAFSIFRDAITDKLHLAMDPKELS